MYNTQHVHKMFDLQFVREIKFFLFPENTSLYKALTSNNFKINQDRRTKVYMEKKCDQMQNVKFRHSKLNLYLDEYCSYFNLKSKINLFDF